MLEKHPIKFPESLRSTINDAFRSDELSQINELCDYADLEPAQLAAIRKTAEQLVQSVRAQRKKSTGIDSFLTQYSLSSEEGIA